MGKKLATGLVELVERKTRQLRDVARAEAVEHARQRRDAAGRRLLLGRLG